MTMRPTIRPRAVLRAALLRPVLLVGAGPALAQDAATAPPDRMSREERILFVDKEEDLETGDRSVEKRILDEIGRRL